MESFYITLPFKFKKNQAGFYNTAFENTIHLNGTYTVGLSEISFPKTWQDIENNQKITLLYYDPTKNRFIGRSAGEHAIVPSGNYTKESLVEIMNDVIQQHFSDYKLKEDINVQIEKFPKIRFSKMDDKFELHFGTTKSSGYIMILPYPELCDILGFSYDTIINHAMKLFKDYGNFQQTNPTLNINKFETDAILKTTYKYNLEPLKNIYMISDICTKRLFGIRKKNILKIVNIPDTSEYGRQISFEYPNPQYCFVTTNDIKSINIKFVKEMNFNDNFDFEDLVLFNTGSGHVTLHFQKISAKSFEDESVKQIPLKNQQYQMIERINTLQKDNTELKLTLEEYEKKFKGCET